MSKQALTFGLTVALVLAGCGTLPLKPSGQHAALSATGTKGPRGDALEWTVFVYMAADNDLSSAVEPDLREMQATLTTAQARYIVLIDQARAGDSRILEIRGNGREAVTRTVDDAGAVIPPGGEADTGSPATLERFVQWGTRHFPSRRSAFVIWNHGGTVFQDPAQYKSFCKDEQANTRLHLPDLWRVFQRQATAHKFDIAGFDVCLLGHIETAYQLGHVADFLVSSEKLVPGNGWDYSAIGTALSAKPALYPRELSERIVDGFGAYYGPKDASAVLSSVDLKKVRTRVVPAVNRLADALLVAARAPETKARLLGIFDQARKGVGNRHERGAIGIGYLARLLVSDTELPEGVRTAARDLAVVFERAVIKHVATGWALRAGTYNGLQIYYDPTLFNPNYGSSTFFGTSRWAELLQVLVTPG